MVDKILFLGSGSEKDPGFDDISILLWADSDESVGDWEYLKRSELRHHQGEYKQIPSAQVRGVANLSMMVAKVLSLQQTYIVEQIKEVARKKYDSYGPRKDFIHQFQGAS